MCLFPGDFYKWLIMTEGWVVFWIPESIFSINLGLHMLNKEVIVEMNKLTILVIVNYGSKLVH